MNGIPILSFLTALPLVGAIIAFFSGRHARGVAMIAALLSVLTFVRRLDALPANGSMGMVEQRPWAPSLGIEYHLGVDGWAR